MSKDEKVTCDPCGNNYPKSKNECPKCGSSITRPDYVEASDYFEKFPRFGVQVTEGYSDSDQKKLRMRKLVPNNNEDVDREMEWRAISVGDAEQLNDLLGSMKELKKKAGWKNKSELLDELHADVEDEEENTEEVEKLLEQYPSFLNEVLEKVDFENLDEKDFELLKETLENLNDTTLQAERKIKEQFSELLGKLTEQEDGYKELSSLLEEWHLLQVTSTSNIALKRLEFLETFEEMIHNEEVYEIRGDDSIHKALERNLWILDEEYWLIQSDKSLKKFVRDEMEGSDKGDQYRRPDFVCATQGDELVIAEIKRPSHTLQRDDLNQIEDYYHYANKYRGDEFNEISCYLIGNKVDEQTRSSADNRRNIQIKTYNDILGSARSRYKEYIDAIEDKAS